MLVLGEDFKVVKPYGNIYRIVVDDSYEIKGKYNKIRIHNIHDDDDDDSIYDVNNDCIYKYDSGWYYVGQWNIIDMNDGDISLIYSELKNYHDKIISYVRDMRFKDIRDKLSLPKKISIGLISKPGMGKTTLIKMVCSTLKQDILIVENKDQEYCFENMTGIVVMEDYDRFDENVKETLDLSLNQTSYSNNDDIPIIFYTSNSTLDSSKLDLLFEFEGHTYNTYKRSVELLFNDNIDEISNLLMSKNITMREANNLLCAAYCSKVHPVHYINEHIGKIDYTNRNNTCKFSNALTIYDCWY